MGDPNWYAPPGADAPLPSGAIAPADPARARYGEFGIRFVARMVDWVTLSIAGGVGGFLGGVLVALLVRARVEPPGALEAIRETTVGSYLVGMLIGLVYHSLAEAVGGATIGKWICGLRTLKDDLSPCTLGAALARNAAFYVDSMFFGVIAAANMKGQPQRKRLGDKWAHTAVVVAKSLPAGAIRSPSIGCTLAFVTAAAAQIAAFVLRGFL